MSRPAHTRLNCDQRSGLHQPDLLVNDHACLLGAFFDDAIAADIAEGRVHYSMSGGKIYLGSLLVGVVIAGGVVWVR